MTATRLAWVDSARGICVLLVVLLHVRIFVYAPLAPPSNGVELWTQLTEFFGAFRLPLLFVVSGFVASRRVRAGWSDRRTVLRAVSLYWIYLVWLTVYAVLSIVVIDPGVPFRVMTPLHYLGQLFVPDSMLWFIFALAAYVIVLSSVNRVPRGAVLGVLAALSIASGAVPVTRDEALWLHVVYYAVFFAVGVHAAPALQLLARSRRPFVLPLSAGTFIVCELAWQRSTEGTILETALRLLRDGAAVAVSIVVIALLVRWRPFERVASAIGQRTLPIFVLQLPLIWLLFLLPPVGWSLEFAPVRYLAPVLGTALIVVAALGIHRLLMRGRARVLFELPERWEKAVLGVRAGSIRL
ncbi:Acyltransferase family protein [Agreia bicolorata]|uniref:Acyltransferase family protein n=1 Tax=Agreia bicolorata TaxID=110935 RepID=A0A1T4YNG7_9MICO|nr:acyltransferase family protein [Agreia bicolorata]SKB03108.1 Acyltransferase family protein [Agreia bicolorata]